WWGSEGSVGRLGGWRWGKCKLLFVVAGRRCLYLEAWLCPERRLTRNSSARVSRPVQIFFHTRKLRPATLPLLTDVCGCGKAGNRAKPTPELCWTQRGCVAVCGCRTLRSSRIRGSERERLRLRAPRFMGMARSSWLMEIAAMSGWFV